MQEIEEKLNQQYYEFFKKEWMPTYKRQVFKAKINEDIECLLAIKENIYKNKKLEKYRVEILKELGIYHLI